MEKALSQAELLEACQRQQAFFIEKIAKLERIIERLVDDASFNACQPSRKMK